MLLSGTCIIIHVYPIEYLRSLFRRVCIQENNCKGQVRYPVACHERVLHNYMYTTEKIQCPTLSMQQMCGARWEGGV